MKTASLFPVYFMFNECFIVTVTGCLVRAVAERPLYCRASSVGDAWIPAKYGCWAADRVPKDRVCQVPGSATCRRRSHSTANSPFGKRSSTSAGVPVWQQNKWMKSWFFWLRWEISGSRKVEENWVRRGYLDIWYPFPNNKIPEREDFSLPKTFHSCLVLSTKYFCRRLSRPSNIYVYILWLQFLQLPSENRFIKNLSGGQQRRVSFAAAILAEPELLILDEPTVGVDPILRQNIWDHMVQITKDGNKTIIITTHYIEETRRVAPHIIIISSLLPSISWMCYSMKIYPHNWL